MREPRLTGCVNIWFPDTCPLCRRLTTCERRPSGVCRECYRELLESPGPFHIVLPVPGEEALIAVAATLYGGVVKRALGLLKGEGRRSLAPVIGRALVRESRGWADGDATVIPIPASRRGRRQRGFDQTELLFARQSREMVSLLARNGNATQKSLNRLGRQRYAERAFRVAARAPVTAMHARDTCVTLVDDVLTTGASAVAAARTLRARGIACRRIFVLAWRANI